MIKKFTHCQSVPELKKLSFLKIRGDKSETYEYHKSGDKNRTFLIWASNSEMGYRKEFAGKSGIIIYDHNQYPPYVCFGTFFNTLKDNERKEILTNISDFVELGLI